MKVLKYGFFFVLIVAIALLLMNGSIPKKYLKAIDGGGATGWPTGYDRTVTQNDWKSFVDRSTLAIAENERRIAAFKVTIEEAGPKALVQYRTAVDALEQKNSELKQLLELYTAERLTEREHFQILFRQRLDSVGRSIQKVLKDNG